MAGPSIVIRERLLAVVVPEPLAVAVRNVEEFGLAGGGGVGSKKRTSNIQYLLILSLVTSPNGGSLLRKVDSF